MEHIIEYNGRRRVASDLEALKLGQQQDQNAEERIFLFPRYLEGFDLSGFACGLLLSGAGWVDRQELILGIRNKMKQSKDAYAFEEGPAVVLVIGVNGVGKTTSVGKLAANYRKQGKKVLIASADTFRAAANEQLTEWAKRAGVDIIGAAEGSDPAAVVYDAVQAAKARRTDILLVDTAGRLHNKKNLMAELKKIDRIITREYPGCFRENWVVLDGTTGQNAIFQAREFASVTNLTGIVLTKMDGTAKGGIAIAVQSELGIPVKFIGVGEAIEDLQKFNPDQFVDAIFY